MRWEVKEGKLDRYCSWLYTRIAGRYGFFFNEKRVWVMYLNTLILVYYYQDKGEDLKIEGINNFVLYYNQYIKNVIEISSGRELLLLY